MGYGHSMSEAASIVVATDFSPHARNAVNRAAQLAETASTSLTLVHVLPGDALEQMRSWLGGGNPAEARLLEEARLRLQESARVLAAARHVPVEAVVGAGSVPAEILREADERDASLIVLGARGTGFMRRLVLGTMAERLMQRTTRPLLVVRQSPHERYRRVLVAVDFSPWSAQALAAAQRVAPDAQLVLTSVYQVPFEGQLQRAGVAQTRVDAFREQARAEATRRVHALAEQAGLRAAQWQACVVEGDASFKIVEMEQECDCDLVVLGKHGTSVVVDTLLGSVTRHVLAEGTSDVLISTRRDA